MTVSLDQAATALPDKESLKVYGETLLAFPGNPSSIHPEGRRAAEKLRSCREELSALLGASGGPLVFTSGATESNNMIITSLTRLSAGAGTGEILLSAVEHPSVWEPVHQTVHDGWTVRVLPVDAGGIVRTDRLGELLTDKTRLVAVMAVNNETGALQPVAEITRILAEFNMGRNRPVHFHCDAVQAAGKIDIPPLAEWGPDSVSFSAHKLGGPRGSGLLWLKKEREMLYRGGGQEGGLRPGTENLPGIASMTSVFLRRYRPDSAVQAVSRRLLEGLATIPGLEILPAVRKDKPELYTPMIIGASVSPVPGEVMVRIMGEAGYLLSTGSACSSNKQKKTRVLEAMGIPAALAHTTIRISTGAGLTEEDADRFIQTLKEQYTRLRGELS